jgi:cytochrome c oxidase subunit 2
MRLSREFRSFLLIWIGASVVATPLVAILLGPLFPPGKLGNAAAGQRLDFTVTTCLATPIFLFVVIYLGYVLVRFRNTRAIEEGPRIEGHRAAQIAWIASSGVIVAGIFAFATYRLLEPGAAGSGQGPTPLSPLAATGGQPTLPVQVIGQQWQFSYRYPTYGGVETPHLVLPVGRTIEFHVTSLDVIHSFWAYGLGVKADANPGVDNVAYVIAKHPGTFDIRCAELCGIWHGYMFDTGRVVTPTQFAAWITSQQQFFKPVTRELPPYSHTYFPAPKGRGG